LQILGELKFTLKGARTFGFHPWERNTVMIGKYNEHFTSSYGEEVIMRRSLYDWSSKSLTLVW